MDDSEKKMYEQLLSEYDKKESLFQEIKDLEERFESEPAGPKRTRMAELIISKMEEAKLLVINQNPRRFICMLVLGFLDGSEKLILKKDIYNDMDLELACLCGSVRDALWILNNEDVSSFDDDLFVSLSIALLEIGKRLPILSSLLGHDIGLRWDDMQISSDYKKIQSVIHGLKSSEASKSNWSRRKLKKLECEQRDQKSYDEAIKEAKKLWENGDRMLHHQMTDFLIYDGVRFNHLNPHRLKKNLKEVAKAYDRVGGFAKGKYPPK